MACFVIADSACRSQHNLVIVAAEFADSAEWILAGYANPANWLADIADVEPSSAHWPLGRPRRSSVGFWRGGMNKTMTPEQIAAHHH